MNDIVIHKPAALPTLGGLNAERLDRFWAGKSADTRRAYMEDLAQFAKWGDYGDAPGAVRALIQMGQGAAHEHIHAYLGALIEKGASSSQVNRRLSALRAVMSLCHQFGMCEWRLEIKGVKIRQYRDTRGPGTANIGLLLKAAAAQGSPPKAARDVAIIRLLFDVVLRRKEVAELRLEHLNLRQRRLSILPKGHRERMTISLPKPTCAALSGWIALRGDQPGPLFTNLDRARQRGGDDALSGDGIHYIITKLGEGLGIKVRPHGLRHSGITEALDRTKGDVRAVRHFSRHQKVDTLLIYDDNRSDMGGQIADIVAGGMGGEEGSK